ncbi:MAG TPA: hypothetical protein PLK31_25625 [Chloroflexota bacterium]|nr:hypothetical protein [Chloroflexota bacterium]
MLIEHCLFLLKTITSLHNYCCGWRPRYVIFAPRERCQATAVTRIILSHYGRVHCYLPHNKPHGLYKSASWW